jgi:hypothetical protein
VEALGYGKVVYERTFKGGSLREEFHEELVKAVEWAEKRFSEISARARKDPLVSGLQRITEILSLAARGMLDEAKRTALHRRISVKRGKEYWLYRAATLLRSPNPDEVNSGIKLAERLELRECEEEVLRSVLKAVPRRHYLCQLVGSGPSCSGFVRRNGVRTLFRWNPSLYSKTLAEFTHDPYWEVRRETVRGLRRAGVYDSEVREMLEKERNFEVLIQWILLAGESGWKEEAKTILPYLSHRNPFIRHATLRALISAVKRGVISAEEAKTAVNERFYTPSRWFEPRSPLLEALDELRSL